MKIFSGFIDNPSVTLVNTIDESITSFFFQHFEGIFVEIHGFAYCHWLDEGFDRDDAKPITGSETYLKERIYLVVGSEG